MSSIRNEKLTRNKILSLRDQYRASFLSDETKEYRVTAFELRPVDEKEKQQTPDCDEMLWVNYKSPQEKEYFLKIFSALCDWLLKQDAFKAWPERDPNKYIIDNTNTNELVFKMPKAWLLYQHTSYWGTADWGQLDHLLESIDSEYIKSTEAQAARRTEVQNESKDPNRHARRKTRDIKRIEIQQALRSGMAAEFFAEAASKKTWRSLLEEDISADFSAMNGARFSLGHDLKQDAVYLQFDEKSDNETSKYLFNLFCCLAYNLENNRAVNDRRTIKTVLDKNKLTILPAEFIELQLTESQITELYKVLSDHEARTLKPVEFLTQANKRAVRQINKKMAGLLKIRQEGAVTYLDYKDHESMPALKDFKHQTDGNPTLTAPSNSNSFITSLLGGDMSRFEDKSNPRLQILVRDLDTEIKHRDGRNQFHTFWGWLWQLFVGEAYSTPVKRAALTQLIAQLSAGKVINDVKDVSEDANIQTALQQGATNRFFKRACVASKPVVQMIELKATASI